MIKYNGNDIMKKILTLINDTESISVIIKDIDKLIINGEDRESILEDLKYSPVVIGINIIYSVELNSLLLSDSEFVKDCINIGTIYWDYNEFLSKEVTNTPSSILEK